ncbi:hypothetical protein F511_13789 [Dorcoceras hygrometricum]|uniref:Uncharacterized protein n=1 Tax=Dorcoceras hygrometricum TaxID=472368 RepID=A0A2Z7BYS8_9LAMI|nr:hypothetical protein F511_13789 [Dorcoceras hygrometricum]
MLLKKCMATYGEGRWHLVPLRAGLNRCRKSCRLRWVNYLSPDIKRGCFTADEIDLMIRLHKLLGNRWSLIAGRIPGRTANDVKNYWNTHVSKASSSMKSSQTKIVKPKPHNLAKSAASNLQPHQASIGEETPQHIHQTTPHSIQMGPNTGSDHLSHGDGLVREMSTCFWELLEFDVV